MFYKYTSCIISTLIPGEKLQWFDPLSICVQDYKLREGRHQSLAHFLVCK